MAKSKFTKVGMLRGLIDAAYNSVPQQPQQAPSLNFGMSKADIDSIYDGYSAQNQTQNAPEIPKLEDNTVTPVQNTSNPTIADELERMRKVKAENKPLSESEQRAVDMYLSDLERASAPDYKPDFKAEIDRMNALANDETVNWSEGEKKAREDYLTRLQNAYEEEQKKNAPVPVRSKITSKPVKTDSKKEKEVIEAPEKEKTETPMFKKDMNDSERRDFENAMREVSKARGRALSANEQRDKDRAMAAIENAKQTTEEGAGKLEEQYGEIPTYDEFHKLVRATPSPTATPTPKTAEEMILNPDEVVQPKKDYSNINFDAVVDTIGMSGFPALERPTYDEKGYRINKSEVKNPEDEKIDRYISPDVKMTKEEKKEAKQILKDYLDENPNAKRAFNTNNPNEAVAIVNQMSDEERTKYQQMATLANKTSGLNSVASGAIGWVPFLKKAEDKTAEMMGVDDKYNASTQFKNAQEQNPLLYMGGEMGAKMGLYSSLSPYLEQIAPLANLTNGLGTALAGGNATVGNVLGRIARGTITDALLDTLPTEAENYANGMRGADLITDAAGNLALNTAFNAGAEAIPYLWDAAKGLFKKPAEEAVETGIDALKNADELNPLEMAKQNEDIANAVEQQTRTTEGIWRLQEQIPDDNSIRYDIDDSVFLKDEDIDDYLKSGSHFHKNKAEAYRNGENVIVRSAKELKNKITQILHYKGSASELNDIGVMRVGSNIADQLKTFDDNVNADNYFFQIVPQDLKHAFNLHRSPKLADDLPMDEDDVVYALANLNSGIVKNVKRLSDGGKRAEILVQGIDGNYYTVQVISKKDGALSLKSIWKKKKGGIDTTGDSTIKGLTTVHSDTTSNSKINQLNESVNPGKFTEGDVNQMVREIEEGGSGPVREFNTPDSGELNERGLANHLRSQVDVRVATPMKVEGVSDEVATDFVDNPDLYKVLKNKDTKALADNIYNSGDATIRVNGKEYTGNVETKFRTLLSEKNPSALPLGHQLAKDYSAAGNHEMAAQIYRDMGQALTESGQFSQASIISMVKNDPLTALQYAEKQLDAINAQGSKRFGKKWNDFKLTDEEIQAFNSITPGDDKAIKALYDKIGARLGKEYPTTFMEKLLEGRKVAMLFNVRTNVRNFGANVPTLGMRWVSDRVDAVGQNIAHLIDPNFKVTNAVTGSGKNGRKLAKDVFNSDQVQALIGRQAGKYEVPELSNSMMKDRQMFKGTAVEKWINKVTNGGIEKINKKLFNKEGVESGLETVRNATYKLLDLGDSPFVRENFIERLGSYINAQNIKDIKDVPDEAIQTAWEEAMKATYKDDSWAVEMLRGLKQGMEKIPGVGKPLSQAVIPFLQAPGNIAARMIDYSPIKATKGVVDIISGATKGSEVAVRKGIEEAAKGLTGTGLIILGMRLHESGILTGNYSEDKDQKNFEKQNGFKPWALHIGDKYFTYDWAQPFGEPLIIGSLLNEAIQNSDKYDSDILNHFGIEGSTAGSIIGATKEGAKASLNSWFNASPLQGLAELMQGDYSGNADIAQNLFDVGVSDFAGALVPAQVNAVAKSIDPTQRNTYDPSSKFGTFLNQQQAKIPGLSDNLPAKYNTWGEEMKYADSVAESALQRSLVPGDYGSETNDPINVEIDSLFDKTQDNKVFPQTAPNKVGDKTLNNKEVSAYQKDMGQRSRSLVEAFINSDLYNTLDDAGKVEVLNSLYGASKVLTERNLFGKDISEQSTYKKLAEAFDEGDVDGVMNELSAKYNPYGLSADTYRKLVDSGEDMTPYEGYGDALKQLNIEDSKSFEKAYAEGGIEGLEKEAEYKSTIKELGLSDTKANKENFSDNGAEGLQKTAEISDSLSDYGLTKQSSAATYEKAKTVIPSLNAESFAKQYKAIDTDHNEGIKQDEIIDYLNKGHYSQEKGDQLWKAYGNSGWKKVPVLEDGKWKKKSK